MLRCSIAIVETYATNKTLSRNNNANTVASCSDNTNSNRHSQPARSLARRPRRRWHFPTGSRKNFEFDVNCSYSILFAFALVGLKCLSSPSNPPPLIQPKSSNLLGVRRRSRRDRVRRRWLRPTHDVRSLRCRRRCPRLRLRARS